MSCAIHNVILSETVRLVLHSMEWQKTCEQTDGNTDKYHTIIWLQFFCCKWNTLYSSKDVTTDHLPDHLKWHLVQQKARD